MGTTKENEMTKREADDIRCTICGRAIADCTIGGLHGMVRDRAAVATKQLRAEGKVR